MSRKIIKALSSGNTQSALEKINANNCNAIVDGYPLLLHAIYYENLEVIEKLLQLGASVNISEKPAIPYALYLYWRFPTSLLNMSYWKLKEIMSVISEYGTADAQDAAGFGEALLFALREAANARNNTPDLQRNWQSIAMNLIRNNAKLDYYHTSKKHFVEMLFDEEVKEKAYYPLHVAIYYGNVKAVKAILEKGNYSNQKTADNVSMSEIIDAHFNLEILEALCRHGFDASDIIEKWSDSKNFSAVKTVIKFGKTEYLSAALVGKLLKDAIASEKVDTAKEILNQYPTAWQHENGMPLRMAANTGNTGYRWSFIELIEPCIPHDYHGNGDLGFVLFKLMKEAEANKNEINIVRLELLKKIINKSTASDLLYKELYKESESDYALSITLGVVLKMWGLRTCSEYAKEFTKHLLEKAETLNIKKIDPFFSPIKIAFEDNMTEAVTLLISHVGDDANADTSRLIIDTVKEKGHWKLIEAYYEGMLRFQEKTKSNLLCFKWSSIPEDLLKIAIFNKNIDAITFLLNSVIDKPDVLKSGSNGEKNLLTLSFETNNEAIIKLICKSFTERHNNRALPEFINSVFLAECSWKSGDLAIGLLNSTQSHQLKSPHYRYMSQVAKDFNFNGYSIEHHERADLLLMADIESRERKKREIIDNKISETISDLQEIKMQLPITAAQGHVFQRQLLASFMISVGLSAMGLHSDPALMTLIVFITMQCYQHWDWVREDAHQIQDYTYPVLQSMFHGASRTLDRIRNHVFQSNNNEQDNRKNLKSN